MNLVLTRLMIVMSKKTLEEYGVHDSALVVHENFFHWVIEDKFLEQYGSLVSVKKLVSAVEK